MTPKLTPALSTSVTTVPAGTVTSCACRASLATSFFGSIENNGTPARTSRGVVMARCYARTTCAGAGCWPTPVRSAQPYGGLPDLDQVPIGVADVGADLGGVVFRFGEELGPFGRPVGVGGGDVGHPEVEERAGLIGVGRCGERNGGLVVGRAAAHVENEPAIGQSQDNGITLQQHRGPEHRPVKLTGPVLIGDHQEVGHHEAGLWGGKVVLAHRKPPVRGAAGAAMTQRNHDARIIPHVL